MCDSSNYMDCKKEDDCGECNHFGDYFLDGGEQTLKYYKTI